MINIFKNLTWLLCCKRFKLSCFSRCKMMPIAKLIPTKNGLSLTMLEQ